MGAVAVTGVAGYLGQRLVARLDADAGVDRIVGIDVTEPATGSPKLEFHQLDVRDARLAKLFVGLDAVVHLAFQVDPTRDEERMRSVNVDGTRNVLEAAGTTGARKVVFVSSTTAYGAHPDNDFPLTERSPLRADPDFPYAVHVLEAERLIEEFRARHPDVVATVLRSALVFGPGADNFVSRTLEAPRLLTVKGYEPPLQVVHTQDAIAALALAVREDIPGVYNLAADGWLSAEEVASLSRKRRAEVPEGVAYAIAERMWRAGIGATPPGGLAYVMYPWVVDNAALRAAGWEPRHTSRDALADLVEAHRGWITIGRARVRRETLARVTVAALGVLALIALARRARRR